ncbi:unknown protein [Seminavis robusta]|uniref:Secreted protein n=1 Tax=Seminavis robusta TaxID=568900 RepID=A0A9N8HPV4_9STRA|nr:unknown protein [Seminavis robusta]|eukprot:Sro1215_g253111.1  (107) ;mRNA; r:1876-2196
MSAAAAFHRLLDIVLTVLWKLRLKTKRCKDSLDYLGSSFIGIRRKYDGIRTTSATTEVVVVVALRGTTSSFTSRLIGRFRTLTMTAVLGRAKISRIRSFAVTRRRR